MTKPDGIANDDGVSPPSWGTWEELLLAFAVNRHGDGAWDSIASELQKRTSDPNLTLTAKTCRLKYLDLKRRFVSPKDESDGRKDKSDVEESMPLLEELRKLRVAELRREVQRYDLNIESLELKMKRMEEEREKTSRREKNESDLENKCEEIKAVKPSPEEGEPEAVGEPVTGGGSEKDQLSVNESNSTDPEAEKLRTGEKESEPVRSGGNDVRQDHTGPSSEEPDELRSEPDRKPVRSDSCNGSSNSIEKEEVKAEPAAIESDADSDGGETKENSDVQSSASKSRKEDDGGSDKVRRGSTASGDEREHEDQSRAVKGLSVESQPFFDFLQAIKSHKLGSVFERRLRSQESSKYQKTILQHLDLETIETRLKEGWYSNSTKFFRDLLLLVNNALVFFSKNSSESNAAIEIRRLISKQLSLKHAKSDSSSGKQISLQSLSMSKKDEPEPLILKPRIPGSLIVCRKRSSIAAKADKKKEQQIEEKDTRVINEEPKITKKRTRDRFPSISANSKKNDKNAPPVEPVKPTGKGGGSSEVKNENKKNQSMLDSKKRGAANFLNRMKQSNGGLLDALKNTPLTSESTSSGKGGSGKKKETSNTNNNTRQSKQKEKEMEKGSPGKRNVGRPPKRGVVKRGRGETESPVLKQQPKKRSRKL